MKEGLKKLVRRVAQLDAGPRDPRDAGLRSPPVFRPDFFAFSKDLGRRPAQLGSDREWASQMGQEISDTNEGIPQVVGGLCADIAHFITVLEKISTSYTGDFRALPRVSPIEADALVGTSRLLARLMDTVPEILAGPLRFNTQYWVGTDKLSGLPSAGSILSESHFVGVSDVAAIAASTKPARFGLFTATGVLGTYGMWRSYLDLHAWSTLNPRPWRTWAVEPHPNAVVHEIASASQWVEFVLSHPQRDGELLFPDWRSVAHHCDAVHMTLCAISATQGLCFPTEQGLVAAPFWDIESTLWLRWCFGSIRLVETVT